MQHWPHSRPPIVAGPWLGEVGFELLYWIPFLRWFAERYRVSRERLIAVARGGSAEAWYGSIASRSHDALSFMPLDEFKRKNDARSGQLGEQKQVPRTPLDEEIISFVRQAEGREVSVLHPSSCTGCLRRTGGATSRSNGSGSTRVSACCAPPSLPCAASVELHRRQVLFQ